jgi:hypothetical protein
VRTSAGCLLLLHLASVCLYMTCMVQTCSNNLSAMAQGVYCRACRIAQSLGNKHQRRVPRGSANVVRDTQLQQQAANCCWSLCCLLCCLPAG